MSNFKLKTTKKNSIVKTIDSLDSKHEKFLNTFHNQEKSVLPNLLCKRNELCNKFKNDSTSHDEKIDIKHEIIKLDNEIKLIKKNKKNYLLNNSNYIFDYFESKKNISDGNNKTKKLDNFFNIKDSSSNSINTNTNNNIEKYMSNIDNNYLNINNYINVTDICRSCNDGELIPVEHEGLVICNKCFKNIKILVDNDKPTYKEPPKEVCFYAYKRINHFRYS